MPRDCVGIWEEFLQGNGDAGWNEATHLACVSTNLTVLGAKKIAHHSAVSKKCVLAAGKTWPRFMRVIAAPLFVWSDVSVEGLTDEDTQLLAKEQVPQAIFAG